MSEVTRRRRGVSEVTLPVKVELTPEILAATFGQWDEETQALFFVRMAEYMEGWGPMNVQTQMLAIGGRLAKDKNADVVRQMLADIHAGIVEVE